MKVSVNWMKQFGGQGLDVPIKELITRIGSQLGEVEDYEDIGTRYKGVLVVKVMECVDHPDSDHMHVCKIDDDGRAHDVERDQNGFVQVVCGATNVREGILVAWLPPGSTVPESIGKEPFVLGKRNLRGVESNGMLASPRELSLGDDHDGILELDDDVHPGDDFAESYGLDDYIINIENKMFTHRPDCFGQLGVAREISGISGKRFNSPEWYLHALNDMLQVDGDVLPLEVRNELPELVPRFLVTTLSGITVKPSPLWLQTYLLRCGVRPISNVVDVTNYIMLLTGQPLHAYDYDKVKALSESDIVTLYVRPPKSNETVSLLNGKTITPRAEAIMIGTESKLLGVGGVMGGSETEVDTTTQNIILECASFDMYSIRRTAMAHGLFTDAVTRFNKGQSPLQNDEISAKTVEMLRELAGAKVAGPVIDNNHVDERSMERRWVHPPVPVTADFINERLGFMLSAGEMKSLLENVECSVETDKGMLIVTAPFWRTDIETREDVVEEIGRLYGFDNLPLELPHRSISPVAKNELFELKSKIRDTLAKAGANEVLTYSFVHGDLLGKVGQDKDQAFQVGNALSPDLQYYRMSLTPSLLDKVHMNIKAGYSRLALFEMGKGHNLQQFDEQGLPVEFEMLDVVYSASDKVSRGGAAFFEARELLVYLASAFGLDLEFRKIESEEDHQVVKPYDYKRSAQVWVVGFDKPLGMVGEYKPSIRRALKLPIASAGFGIDLLMLMQASREQSSSYLPLSRFPGVSQDLSLEVPATMNYSAVYSATFSALSDHEINNTSWSLEPLDLYQAEDDPGHHTITLRLRIASHERTLTDVEITRLLDEIVEDLNSVEAVRQ